MEDDSEVKIISAQNPRCQKNVNLIPTFKRKKSINRQDLGKHLNEEFAGKCYIEPVERDRNPLVLEADPDEKLHRKYNYEYHNRNSIRNRRSSQAPPMQTKHRTHEPISKESVYKPQLHHVDAPRSKEAKFCSHVKKTALSNAMTESHVMDPPLYKEPYHIKVNPNRAKETAPERFHPGKRMLPQSKMMNSSSPPRSFATSHVNSQKDCRPTIRLKTPYGHETPQSYNILQNKYSGLHQPLKDELEEIRERKGAHQRNLKLNKYQIRENTRIRENARARHLTSNFRICDMGEY